MAVGTRRISSAFERWMQRVWRGARGLFAPGDAVTLIVLMVMLLMPVLALSAAGWPLAMQTVLPVLVLSVAFGFILARSHYNELVALIMSGLYG
ncbi:MAG: hypothetical protein K8L99_06005, partial [Anaerolineae bacterium]|nr:hypothetical protein [Anaerolineae bacterium]